MIRILNLVMTLSFEPNVLITRIFITSNNIKFDTEREKTATLKKCPNCESRKEESIAILLIVTKVRNC